VVLWGGWPFFERGARSLVTRHLNMFTLIALGTGVAFLYSVVAVFAPGLFPAAFREPHGGVALYFEAAAVITVLVLLGQVLELRARARPRARSAHCSISHQRKRGGSPPTAATPKSRLMKWPSETACACAPAKRSGRRHDRGRPLGARRVHGHRRIHAGGEE